MVVTREEAQALLSVLHEVEALGHDSGCTARHGYRCRCGYEETMEDIETLRPLIARLRVAIGDTEVES